MQLHEKRGYVVHRAFRTNSERPRYQAFYDGNDYHINFNNEQRVIEELEENFGKDWKAQGFEIHQVQVTEERIN